MSDQIPNPLLSVIVPAYNRADDLATLLGSLASQQHRLDIVVVDDCSPNPAVYDDLKTRHPHVRFIRQATNRGPAAARNRGAREAKCELLFFIDSDTAVVDGAIDTILRIYREHPDFVVCCGTCDKRPINDGLFAHYKALLEASWIDDRRGRITYIRHLRKYSRLFNRRKAPSRHWKPMMSPQLICASFRQVGPIRPLKKTVSRAESWSRLRHPTLHQSLNPLTSR